MSASPEKRDRFGNLIDSQVGYARGSILRSSYEETLRLAQARVVIRDRIAQHGAESIALFTGNQRDFPIYKDDLSVYCEEWMGPAVFERDLREAILEHLGGRAHHAVAVFNRTSAGIVAAIIALAAKGLVISIAPPKTKSHASVIRGAELAGSHFIEVHSADELSEYTSATDLGLIVITSVSSSLDSFSDGDIAAAVSVARKTSAPILIDDAYGARMRPVLHKGRKSLEFDVQLAISNADKSGLEGPRAGFMAGEPELVGRVQAKAAELGQEARAPIAVGVMRALQRYKPRLLLDEALHGSELADALVQRLSDTIVTKTDIGPMITEEEILATLLARSGNSSKQPVVVPCEASSAVGMFLLQDHGMLTVNICGQPGAKVSLRLKPTGDALERLGGAKAIAKAVDQTLSRTSEIINNLEAIAAAVLGESIVRV